MPLEPGSAGAELAIRLIARALTLLLREFLAVPPARGSVIGVERPPRGGRASGWAVGLAGVVDVIAVPNVPADRSQPPCVLSTAKEEIPGLRSRIFSALAWPCGCGRGTRAAGVQVFHPPAS